MKKNYAKICAMLLSDMDFKLIKQPEVEGIQYYSLEDLQGANLGKIEKDRFDNTAAMLDRLDIYYNDYILDDLNEIYGLPDVYSKSFEELLEECKNNPHIPSYYIDWLELITQESFNVNINDVYEEQEIMKNLSNMQIEGRAEDCEDFWIAVGDTDDYEHWILHISKGTSDLSEEDDEEGYESYIYYDVYENDSKIRNKITEFDTSTLWKYTLKEEDDGGACMLYQKYENLSLKEICYNVLIVAGFLFPEQLKIRLIK